MKSINTIQEAQQVINDLQNQIDTIRSKNWDRHQTRIVNAHPSVDPYDYVVRKELDRLGGTTVAERVEGGYDKCTFGIAIDSVLYVANDTNPRYICAANSLTLKWMAGIVKVPAVGSGITCRFNKNPVDPQSPQDDELICNFAFLESEMGTVKILSTDDFLITEFVLSDLITVDVTEVGATTPGGGVVFVMKFRINDSNPL